MSVERDRRQATPDSDGPDAGSGGFRDLVRQALGGGTTQPPRPASTGDQATKNDASDQPRGRRVPIWLVILALLAVNYVVGLLITPGQPARMEVPYTLFRQQVTAGNVAEIVSRGDAIQGTFKQAVTYTPDSGQPATTTQFSTVRPAFADPGLESELFN
jgi:hypothetical protein